MPPSKRKMDEDEADSDSDMEEPSRLKRRAVAVKCWYESGGDVQECRKLFAEQAGGPIPKRAEEYCKKWADRFEQDFNVADRRCEKCSRMVEDEVAMQCADELVGGRYSSLADAHERSTFIQDVCAECAVTPEHLLRRMHQVDPLLRKCVRVTFKFEHTAEQRAERIRIALRSLGLVEAWKEGGRDLLQRVVFVDAKTLYILPKDFKVWGRIGQAVPPSVGQTATDERLKNMAKGKKSVFYLAVAAGGPVMLVFSTGTSDFDSGYKVGGWAGWLGGGLDVFITACRIARRKSWC